MGVVGWLPCPSAVSLWILPCPPLLLLLSNGRNKRIAIRARNRFSLLLLLPTRPPVTRIFLLFFFFFFFSTSFIDIVWLLVLLLLLLLRPPSGVVTNRSPWDFGNAPAQQPQSPSHIKAPICMLQYSETDGNKTAIKCFDNSGIFFPWRKNACHRIWQSLNTTPISMPLMDKSQVDLASLNTLIDCKQLWLSHATIFTNTANRFRRKINNKNINNHKKNKEKHGPSEKNRSEELRIFGQIVGGTFSEYVPVVSSSSSFLVEQNCLVFRPSFSRVIFAILNDNLEFHSIYTIFFFLVVVEKGICPSTYLIKNMSASGYLSEKSCH